MVVDEVSCLLRTCFHAIKSKPCLHLTCLPRAPQTLADFFLQNVIVIQ